MEENKFTKILNKYIKNPSLINHSEKVANAMKSYANELGKSPEEINKWFLAGLFHDIDWELYPDEHPNKAINEILPEEGINDIEILNAIASHAPERTKREPQSEIEKYLFACDELSGFLNACAILRPQKFEGMKTSSVLKNLKNNRFASGVNREDIKKGVELIGKSIEEHIEFLIKTFQKEI